MALRVICADEIGKRAVRDQLKSIRLKNVKDPKETQIGFSSRTLTMHCAYAHRTDGMYSDNQIRETLMAGLE